MVGVQIEYWVGATHYALGAVPDHQAQTLLHYGDAGEYAWSSGSLYTTNNSNGADLGTFTTSSMLKSVQFEPENLRMGTYEIEGSAVALGFGIGLTIAVFRFIKRLVKAIPTHGGDY